YWVSKNRIGYAFKAIKANEEAAEVTGINTTYYKIVAWSISGLFTACAGAIYATAHYTEIGQLKGLARRMPWTCAAFTIGSLSLVGVPGFSGFVGKLLLARGAMDAGDVLYAVVLIGASLFTAAYLFPILQAFYFEEPDSPHHADTSADAGSHPHGGAGEARLALRIPLVTTAVLVVLFGIAPAIVNTQYGLAAIVTTRVFGATPPDAPGESR
ncbi:MAG: proton-conducting transporter membrane subunit, partial [Vicinamibacterales bacterium]|nr:proton-conducting transporter membrane subunit [Vicinamibacterales bacterium]